MRAAADFDDVAVAWVEAIFASSSGLDRARSWLARVTNQDPAAVACATDRVTRYDLDQLRRSLPVDPNGPAARTAFALLSAHAAEALPDPVTIVRDLSADGRAASRAVVFRGFCELYPEGQWPSVLVVPPTEGLAGWLARTVAYLEAVATAVPELPVAVAAPRVESDAASGDASSHIAAVIREGLVVVEGLTEGELDARLRAAGVVPPPTPATMKRLVADGLTDDAAASFVEAARAVRDPTPDDVASDFRSVHEQFLFEQLESMPETAGQFRPNRALPFLHGPRAAEADLLAEKLKLVVEVDGQHYHLTQPQYRRDRRKDWLYQQHGYLVLRFLAEDVVEDLENILTTILTAVALRRDRSKLER
ncbi:hypothetical protein FRUB_06250 [Fimbriiglobus ruber]|uniref:DUF559 domain-containing protein n=1 Tax=Fimbriiglobus ruber TaxID=1908690 RepID=A0A225DKQ7_9BACT|nr:hypothetical protein FRUB_06250 [Fimbriiglobus ruber]